MINSFYFFWWGRGGFLNSFSDSKEYKSHQFVINSNVVLEFESNYFK